MPDARIPSIAVAESLTVGHVQALIGSISGSSAFFRGGVTAYTLDMKVQLLGVDRAHATAVDCISERVACEMAAGACRLFQAQIGLATTGYAEVSTGVLKPFAWWALVERAPVGSFAVSSGRIECPGLSRTAVQKAVAGHVVGALRAHLAERGIQFPDTTAQCA